MDRKLPDRFSLLLRKYSADFYWCGTFSKKYLDSAVRVNNRSSVLEAATSVSAAFVSCKNAVNALTFLLHGEFWRLSSSRAGKKRQPVTAVPSFLGGLSHPLCTTASRTAVHPPGCCGWLLTTSFVYVFRFGWLWWFQWKTLCVVP